MSPRNPETRPQGPTEVLLDPTPVAQRMTRREMLGQILKYGAEVTVGTAVVNKSGAVGMFGRLIGAHHPEQTDTVAGWHVNQGNVTVDCPREGGNPTDYKFEVTDPEESWNKGTAQVTADGLEQDMNPGETKIFKSKDNKLEGDAVWDTNGDGVYGDAGDESYHFSFEADPVTCEVPATTTTTEAATTTTTVAPTTTTGAPQITGGIVSAPPAPTTTTTTRPPRPPATNGAGN